jgi:O-antigen ligase
VSIESTIQLIGRILRKIEPVIVVLLLLYFTDVNLPRSYESRFNMLSYGIVLLLVLGTRQLRRFFYVLVQDPLILMLLGLSLFSFFWSASPDFTANESKVVLRATLLGAYLATRYTPRQIIIFFAWALGIAAVLSFIYAQLNPAYAVTNTNGQISWRGIYTHKQYFGRTMALAAITFWWCALERWRYRWVGYIGVVATIAMVFLSESRSSLVVLAAALLFVPLSGVFQKSYKLRTVLLFTFLLFFSSVILLFFGNYEFLLIDVLGKDLDLNGRMPIWTAAIQKGTEHLWFGHGFAGFWTSPEAWEVIRGTWAAKVNTSRFHAHNGFIDLFLDLGLVGLGLMVLSFVLLLTRITKLMGLMEGKEAFWMLQYLVVFFLTNLTIVRTFVTRDTTWILYVALAFSSAVWIKRLERERIQARSDMLSLPQTALTKAT